MWELFLYTQCPFLLVLLTLTAAFPSITIAVRPQVLCDFGVDVLLQCKKVNLKCKQAIDRQ